MMVVSRDGYSVDRAARRLACSESTVRRHVRDGVLEQVSGVSQIRVTEESVERERARILDDLGVRPESDSERQVHLREVEGLQEENKRLRAAIQDMRRSDQALNDAIGKLTDSGGSVG